MKILKFFTVLGILLEITSCIPPNEQVKTIPLDGEWLSKYPAQFEFTIEDYQTPKNIIFVIRNNNSYPYSNIRLFTSIYSDKAKNQSKTDTLNYIMAKPNGEWLGTGFGNTKEMLFLYKSAYQFPKNGKYIIEVKHAMRKNPLIGLDDIGIKIETLNP